VPGNDGARHNAIRAERILLVSNDEQLRALLCELFVAHGYANVLGMDALTALAWSNRLANPAVAIVDTSVSCVDAVRAIGKLKKSGNASIVVIAPTGDTLASANPATNGDVLLVKPFDPRELVFIVRTMLRGQSPDAVPTRESLSVGPIRLHTLLNTVTVATREIDLTGVETRVLEELLVNAGNPVSRDHLMRRALGREWSPFDRCLDSHIKRVRRKIGADRHGRTPIRTLRGIGYLLLAEWEPRA
jgi:DNA-binding response OmpR family regulator